MTTHDTTTLPTDPAPKGKLVTEFIDPATDARWDGFVEKHPFGWLTHLSSWKKVVEESFDHMRGYYPALVDASNGEIRAALPVFEVKSWLTGMKMVSIPWATLSDPLVSCRGEFDLLIGEVDELSRKLGASHVELRTLHAASLIQDEGMSQQPHFKHHYLDLDRNMEALMKSFHRTCVRQRIRRALSSNLTLRIGEREEHLRVMYALHLKNRKSKYLPPQPFLFFQNIWETLFPEKRVSLLLAEHAGKPVAALLLFKFKERVSAEIAHMDDDYRGMSPNIFLFWEAMKRAADEGYRIFDFGRTPPTNQSLLAFKSRWGTKVSNIHFFYYPEEMAKKLTVEHSRRYKLVQVVCKNTPEFLQPYIGRFCYRHI